MARFVKLYPRPVTEPKESIEVNVDAVTWISTPYPSIKACRLHLIGGETINVDLHAWEVSQQFNVWS